MSLKAKLISTTSAFVLILTIVIVAVWAATQANVSLGGTINFQATNVYAKVTGTVTGMEDNPTLPTLIFSEGEGASEETDIEQWNNLNLVFNTSGTPIEIEVTVENLSDERSLGVSIQNQIASIENIDISITKNSEASTSATLSPSTGSGTSTVTFLVTVSLQNPNISVTDAIYDILITLTDESQMKQINVYSNDPSLGTLSGGGLYAPGSTVTLTATANDNSAAIVFGFTADSVDGPMLQFFLNDGPMTTAYFTFSLNDIDSTDYYAIFISEEDYSQMFGWATGDGFSDNPTNYEHYGFFPELDVAFLLGVYRNEEGVSIEEYKIPETVMGPVSAPDDPTSVSEMKEYRVIGFWGTINQPSSVYLFDGSSFENLKKVIIPENVTIAPFGGSLRSPTIESYEVDPNNPVFSAVNGNVLFDRLTKTVLSACKGGEIPEGTKVIGEDAFLAHEFESITIPQSVVLIDSGAFQGCSSLTSITIPEGVTSIGSSAFEDCSNLTSITLPSTLTSIEYGVFSYCSSLTSITIPESVTSIGIDAFSGCSNLSSITIPESVTSIGSYAFKGCSNLTSVTIEGVTSIGDSAFHDCSSLTSITIPEGVTSIGHSAFFNCSSLTSITLPSTLTSIGSSAFYNCSGLTSITIPERVTSIEGSAFYNCSNLTSITIPEGVTSIGDYAFYYCRGLTSITIPEGVTSIGSSAFSACLNLTSITIPEGVTSIGYSAFRDCSSLTSVTIEGVTSIGGSAFYNCSNLAEITINGNISTPGVVTVFRGCSNLTKLTLGSNVTSLPDSLFGTNYLENLTTIVVEEGSTLSAALPTYGKWVKDGATVTSFSGAGTYTRTDV